jgi:hypothetical protein
MPVLFRRNSVHWNLAPFRPHARKLIASLCLAVLLLAVVAFGAGLPSAIPAPLLLLVAVTVVFSIQSAAGNRVFSPLAPAAAAGCRAPPVR